MRKKLLVTAITVLLISSLMVDPSFTQSYSRSITAWFNNLAVEVDGTKVTLKNEPFIFNNEVYVPIRELSDHVLFNYQHDQQAGTIKLKTNRNQSTATDNYQHHFEVIALRKQITELEKEIQLLQDGKFPYKKITTVAEMEDYLKQNFKKIGNVPVTLRFRHIGGNRYNFSAVFNNNDLTAWNSLNRREIENWVDDVFEVIKDLFNPNAEIEGDIRISPFNLGTRQVNYWTRGSRLFFEFKQAEHKKNVMVDGVKIENALNQHMKYYNNAIFTYQVFVNQMDIDVVANFNQNFAGWSPNLKMQYLTRLKAEIAKVYDNVNVNGRVVNGSTSKTELRFSFEDGHIRSVDLLNDLEKHLNTYYKNYYYGGHNFSFTYRLSEGYSGSFQVVLEGNFADNHEIWQLVKSSDELGFRYFIQNAFYYVESIWDVDIFGTVVDKNLKTITDVEYYKTSIYGIRNLQPIIFQ